ncbi:MAG TPA: YtxH domain-containing protein [Terriglobales bacterium]|nr:YtxH domain-containing protein [Terriglobales bacterium]
MRREKNSLLDLLVDAGLYLLDPVRERVADHIDTVSEKAKDAYQEASGRVRKASRAITGEDQHGLSSTAALLLGVGVGVALGILFAPASGEQVRRNIADTARDFGGRIRRGVSGESDDAGPADRL